MKRIPVLIATVAALYMLFVVLYSSRVMYSAMKIPLPLASERPIRPTSAVKHASGGASVLKGVASVAEATGAAYKAAQFKPNASSIASWCSRMQHEGDVIARSFDGGARSNVDAFYLLMGDLRSIF
jgi:hypothetical protein